MSLDGVSLNPTKFGLSVVELDDWVHPFESRQSLLVIPFWFLRERTQGTTGHSPSRVW